MHHAAHRLLRRARARTASTTDTAQTQSDGELRELTVVLDWYPNALHAFLYQAEQAGYFAEEGLTVNIQPPAGVNDAMSMVAAGPRGDRPVLPAGRDPGAGRAGRAGQVDRVRSCRAPLNIILSLKDKDITEPADLVGKTVGYAGTELCEALVRSIMEHSGADASSVELVDVGFDLMSLDGDRQCGRHHRLPGQPRGAADGEGGL